MEQTKEKEIAKSAFRVFSIGATMAFLTAIIYCYGTHHILEAGAVIIAGIAVGFLAARTYRSL